MVNTALDPIHGAVPFDQLENPPKDAFVLIQNHGDKDGGASQVVSLNGAVMKKSSSATSEWYSAIRLWEGEEFIIASGTKDGYGYQQWLTSKDGQLQEIQLPSVCQGGFTENASESITCVGSVSLSPDQQQILLAGWRSDATQSVESTESVYVLWNRLDNSSQVIRKADLPIDEQLKNDRGVYLSIEWEKSNPHTAFVIVQKEQEGVVTQLARFRYSTDSGVYESYGLTADYGPLMIPVVQENARMLDMTSASPHPISLPYTYEKFGGVLIPFQSIVVRDSKTQVGSTIMRWRKFFGFNSVYVYQVGIKDNPEWFIVRIDNNLFLTKIGSTQYSYITSLPYEAPEEMPTIMVDIVALNKQ